MTFELTGVTCALLLVGVAHALGMVGHMQQSVRMAKRSLVPRPHPDFISQPWRKIGRRPGIKTTSRTGNGGLGLYVTWTWFVLTESTISGP